MNLDLDEREQATLIGVLVEVIETSQLARSPRLEAAKSILTKLGIHPVNLPTPAADLSMPPADRAVS